MKLFRSRIEIGGQKYTETQILEKALVASKAIILNGFNSAEELYNLLRINCLDSSPVINKCLAQLALKYNESATHEAEAIFEIYNDNTSRDSHVANTVLMDNKLKIIADVRSFIATKCADNLEALPIFENSVNYVGADPSNLAIETNNQTNVLDEKVVAYKNSMN